jgi:hypothetical protein
MLDINMDNNYKKSKGIVMPSIGFLTGMDNMKKKQLFLLPIGAGNDYDGFMLGLNFNNLSIPLPKWKVNFNTFYGFNSGKVVGTGRIQYDQPIKKNGLERITYKLSSRRFSFEETEDGTNIYETIVPSVAFSFDHGEGTLMQSELELKHTFAEWGSSDDKDAGNYTKLSYGGKRNSALYPTEFNVNSVKIDGFIKQSFQFMEGRMFNVRFYGGFFPLQSDEVWTQNNKTAVGNNNINLVFNGEADHAFEVFFMGRTAFFGGLDNQILMRDGGFKLGNLGSGHVGQSDRAAFAVNLETQLPVKFIPKSVRLYFDYGSYSSAITQSSRNWETIYSGGVMLNFFDFMNVYVPLYSNETVTNGQLETTTFFNGISFTLDMNKLDIIDLYNNFRI